MRISTIPSAPVPRTPADEVVGERPDPARVHLSASPAAGPERAIQLASGVEGRELMERVRSGDVGAFEAVVEEHWSGILLYARHLLRDRDQAYDVTQEAFSRLWAKRKEWVGSGSVRVWLLRTARNLAISEQRRWKVRAQRALQVAQEYSPLRTPLDDAEKHELRVAIERAMWKLSPRRREVFTLCHLQGLSYREAAAILGIRPQSVANQLGAAVAELRVQLAPFHGSRTAETEGAPDGSPRGSRVEPETVRGT